MMTDDESPPPAAAAADTVETPVPAPPAADAESPVPAPPAAADAESPVPAPPAAAEDESPVPAPPAAEPPSKPKGVRFQKTYAFDSSPLYKTREERAEAKAKYAQLMKERETNKELNKRQAQFQVAGLSAIAIFLWAVLMTAFWAQERRYSGELAETLDATNEELAVAQAAAGMVPESSPGGVPPPVLVRARRQLQLLFSSDNKSGWQDANTKSQSDYSNNPYEEKITPFSSLATGLASLAQSAGAASIHVNSGNLVSAGAPYFYASQDLNFGNYAQKPGMGDIQLMNGLNLAATGMGKYDFSGGLQAVGAMVSASAFPWVSANLDLTPIRPMLASLDHPLTLTTTADLCSAHAGTIVKSCYVRTSIGKVGLVGVSPEDLFSMIPPTMGMDMENMEMGTNTTMATPRQAVPMSAEFFNATVKQVQDQITLLEETAGADIIVLLDQASGSGAEVSAMVKALTGVDVVLATAVQDMGGSAVSALPNPVQIFSALRDADAVMTADEIQGYPMVATDAQANTVLVVGPVGDNWRYLGNLMVEFSDDGKVITWDGARSGPVATTQENANAMAAMLGVDTLELPKQILATLSTLQSTPTIAAAFETMDTTTEFPLIGEWYHVRTRNTNLGNLVADAYKWTGSQLSTASNGAFLNGGSIYDSIEGPEVVPYAIAQSLALNNEIRIVEITAAQLIAALEHSVSALPAADGRFPHLSNNILVSANIGRPPLEGMEEVTEPSRIEFLIVTSPDGSSDVIVQAYVPVGDLSRTFTIATSSLLHNDQVGFKAIAAAKLVPTETNPLEQQALQDYMTGEMAGSISLADPPMIPRLTVTDRA